MDPGWTETKLNPCYYKYCPLRLVHSELWHLRSSLKMDKIISYSQYTKDTARTVKSVNSTKSISIWHLSSLFYEFSRFKDTFLFPLSAGVYGGNPLYTYLRLRETPVPSSLMDKVTRDLIKTSIKWLLSLWKNSLAYFLNAYLFFFAFLFQDFLHVLLESLNLNSIFVNHLWGEEIKNVTIRSKNVFNSKVKHAKKVNNFRDSILKCVGRDACSNVLASNNKNQFLSHL